MPNQNPPENRRNTETDKGGKKNDPNLGHRAREDDDDMETSTPNRNRGNFANDPQRAREAGQKGGSSRGGNRH